MIHFRVVDEIDYGVDFTNVLLAAFTAEDPKNTKRWSSHQYLFVLLESLGVKAACKTFVKVTHDRE